MKLLNIEVHVELLVLSFKLSSYFEGSLPVLVCLPVVCDAVGEDKLNVVQKLVHLGIVLLGQLLFDGAEVHGVLDDCGVVVKSPLFPVDGEVENV